MLHRRSRQDGRYSLLLPITVPVMGFDLEDIQLDLELTSDLTLAVFASSGRLNKKHSVRRETQELRFAYSIAQERGVK